MQQSNSYNNNHLSVPLILHIYELKPNVEDPRQLSSTDRALCMVSGFLPSIGMGAYHSSLEVFDLIYTFSNAGVMVSRKGQQEAGVPAGGTYKQNIRLAELRNVTKAQLPQVIQRLSTLFYTPHGSYNYVHRNCNHFTETLATALIIMEQPHQNYKDSARLQTYPKWLNRLANTGAMVGVTGSSSGIAATPSQILNEAKVAAGL
mmetsp:Transcript_6793/g.9918  ORF Transcript_6793/g.9918 Transcript_6793/m.9918 type:complete len:204 (+) Transcript_6793:52-663(+)